MDELFCGAAYYGSRLKDLVDPGGGTETEHIMACANWCSSTINHCDYPYYEHYHCMVRGNKRIEQDKEVLYCVGELENREQEEEQDQDSMNDEDPRGFHFEILSRDNPEKSVQVLTRPLMRSLQVKLPLSKQGQSFWLQYSLVRDGASLGLLIDKLKDTTYSVLAVETMDGEVFGSFTCAPWKLAHDYFGSGESFLWRSTERRYGRYFDDTASYLEEDPTQGGNVEYPSSREDKDDYDDAVDLDFFPYSFQNSNIQLCQSDRLVVGGGNRKGDPRFGFGLCLDADLMGGSSSPCLTFDSPSLSRIHHDGSTFEIANLEVWALTPYLSVEDAERSQRIRRAQSGAAFFKRSFSFQRNSRTNSLASTSRRRDDKRKKSFRR